MLLRIYVGERDMFHEHPVYEALVLKAREMHLAGATVIRGVMGYGASARLHTAKILTLSTDLPFVVEIVDKQEKIEAFLKAIEPMVTSKGVLVTREELKVMKV